MNDSRRDGRHEQVGVGAGTRPVGVEERAMSSYLRRPAPFVLLVLLALAPVAQALPAQRCESVQVETFTLRTGPAPAALRAGTTVTVPVQVVRGGGTALEQPAAGVSVVVTLIGQGWATNAQPITDAQGRVAARLTIPRKVRGTTRVEIEGLKRVPGAPCPEIEEHGQVKAAWARVS